MEQHPWDKRMAIIFDECHRSQFGKNHDAIKSFFPKSQLFGFAGPPIFDKNATAKQFQGSTEDALATSSHRGHFRKELHHYAVANAIEDGNVLKFHIDYFKPEAEKGKPIPKPAKPSPRAVIKAILEKHDAVTAGRKFNALFATASINDAIKYHQLFASIQSEKASSNPDFRPLKIACVSPHPPRRYRCVPAPGRSPAGNGR